MADVAARAGLSAQTVSNVINAPERVRPQTRARVMDAIAAVGYRPNTAARQLRTRRSMIIGLRLRRRRDGINGNVLDRFLHALTELSESAGYRVMLYTARDDAAEIEAYEELIDSVGLDAFVLTDTGRDDRRLAWLNEHGVACAAFGRPWLAGSRPPGGRERVDGDADQVDRAPHAWVDVDGRRGTAAAVRHLHSLGHTRIGFLGWPAGSGLGDERRAGWRQQLIRFGLEDALALDRGSQDGVPQGAHGARELIAAGATALVCASDSLALGARSHTRAVIGFDDTPVAAAVGMSSIAQPVEAAAAHVVALLARTLGDPLPAGLQNLADGPRHVLLEPELIIREDR